MAQAGVKDTSLFAQATQLAWQWASSSPFIRWFTDGADWHTSDQVVLPDGLHLEFLPSYSPELQPAERLWSILDEPIANRTFEKIEELEQMLCDRCCVLLQQCDFIRGLTNFHWWQLADA